MLRDYEGTEQVTILRRQDPLRFYTARPVMARPRPALRSSNYQPSDDGWASVLVEDVYKGLESCRESDRIVQIAVVQELEKSKFADVSRRAFGFQFPVVSCGATYAPKKVWGFARVEADGSAHFKVPAQVPIYFMAVDEFGRAIQRMRSFTHLMPGEQQSCVGCHADRNYVTPNTSARPVGCDATGGRTHAARMGRARIQLSAHRATGARSVLRGMPQRQESRRGCRLERRPDRLLQCLVRDARPAG